MPTAPLPRVNVSIKLSSLYSQFDPLDAEGTSAAVRARLRPILRAARRQRAFVNVDMEQYAFKDLTLRIFREVLTEEEFRDWPDVGIAIQAYLRDCAADLESLAGLGGGARHAGLGAAHQGSLLGLRDHLRGPAGLAGARLHAEMGDRRQLRKLDHVPAGAARPTCGRPSAATMSAAWPMPWRKRKSSGCRRPATKFRCSTACRSP